MASSHRRSDHFCHAACRMADEWDDIMTDDWKSCYTSPTRQTHMAINGGSVVKPFFLCTEAGSRSITLDKQRGKLVMLHSRSCCCWCCIVITSSMTSKLGVIALDDDWWMSVIIQSLCYVPYDDLARLASLSDPLVFAHFFIKLYRRSVLL